MNLLTTQIYGNSVAGFNTEIGGVSATISTASALATKLGISVVRIKNFTIVGSDIKCKIIGGGYAIPANAFSTYAAAFPNVLTYYIDNDSLVNTLNTSCFFGQNNFINFKLNGVTLINNNNSFNGIVGLKEFYLPNLITINNSGNFAHSSFCEVIYIPNCTTIGTSPSVNDGNFTAIKTGSKIYAHPSMATINGGGVEADLAAAIAAGNIVRYVTSYTNPLQPTSTAIGTVYNTAIQFVDPLTSANVIDYYEVSVNGGAIIKINAGDYITGLTPSTNYNLTLTAVDIFYNKSIVSNSLSVTTSNVSDTYYPATEVSGDAFLTAAGISDVTISDSIRYLAFQLKNKSLWQIQKAVYPIVGASASTHKWNLKDPRDLDVAFRLNIPASGYTHAGTGMKGTVTGCNTYIQPSTQLSLNNAHLSFYSRDNTSGAYVEMGSQATLYIASNYSNVNYMAVNNSDSNQGAGINMQSFIQVSRISSTQMKQYRNGSLIVTASVNSGSLNPNNIFLIGYNLYPTARECAFASIGEGMTDTQATDFYNIVQQFQTMLSRQV